MSKKANGQSRPWLLAALVALVVLSFYRMGGSSGGPTEMSAAEFRAAVAAGRVSEPILRVVDHDAMTTYLEGDVSEGGESSRFRVYLVPGENERLMEDLSARGVKVRVKNESSAFSPLVTNLLFFFGFMALLYWFMAKRMGGAGPFGMGKSKAKLLNGKEEKRKVTFADVAGVDEAKEEVQEIVEFLKEPSAFQKLGGRIPKGVLLVGPPGTGKTLLAKAIAGEAKVPFFSISGSDFEEMFVGVGASRVRDLFKQAKDAAPAIIFIEIGRAHV